MRRVALITVVLAASVAFVVLAAGAGQSKNPHYWIKLDNAFGLVTGADFKVAGVRAGRITDFKLDKDNRALVGVQINQAGFGAFHADDVHCKSRPQSLIGEYFIDCDPGTHGAVLKNGATIPVDHTESTVAPDLVNNVLRMPYRERLRLLINELGAAVAGNGEALNEALHRANPALRDTDRVLKILGDQRNTIADLTSNADKVVTALAQNGHNVQRFVVEAKRTAQASAERRGDLQATFHKFPAFLEELKPTMAELGRTADAQGPALSNLAAAAPQLVRFFHDLVPFSRASTPAFRALGRASVTGRQAVRAAGPTIALLNSFGRKAPEVGKNLAIILHDLDDRNRAVENDPRAAAQQGRAKGGYSFLEAVLQYVFNQSVAINAFDANGQHLLRVNAFTNDTCGPYTNTKRLKDQYNKPGNRQNTLNCLSYLGKHQPNIACAIPGFVGGDPSQGGALKCATNKRSSTRNANAKGTSGGGLAGASPSGSGGSPNAGSGIGDILRGLTGQIPGASHLPPAPGVPKVPGAAPQTPQGGGGLLNYLLAP